MNSKPLNNQNNWDNIIRDLKKDFRYFGISFGDFKISDNKNNVHFPVHTDEFCEMTVSLSLDLTNNSAKREVIGMSSTTGFSYKLFNRATFSKKIFFILLKETITCKSKQLILKRNEFLERKSQSKVECQEYSRLLEDDLFDALNEIQSLNYTILRLIEMKEYL